jgi:nicotinate-nucleotide pyrophosphorylase (carboxylating)
MTSTLFEEFFQGERKDLLMSAIELALREDGPDLTSSALFPDDDTVTAEIVAKQEALACGLPMAYLVLETLAPGSCRKLEYAARDGDKVKPGHTVLALSAPARSLLAAERVILNFITHLSGIATLVDAYAQALKGAETVLLDTRKTLPGLRVAEKYAVRVGGGMNHRMGLGDMLMAKDNHIDLVGGISEAVKRLRESFDPCPPIEVECRGIEDVREAVALSVDRIMLDNMDPAGIRAALAEIPDSIQSEVSGGVDLSNIAEIVALGPDFVSVGRLTHSAPAADFSMRINKT